MRAPIIELDEFAMRDGVIGWGATCGLVAPPAAAAIIRCSISRFAKPS